MTCSLQALMAEVLPLLLEDIWWSEQGTQTCSIRLRVVRLCTTCSPATVHVATPAERQVCENVGRLTHHLQSLRHSQHACVSYRALHP